MADAVLLDLEDGVTPDQKARTRLLVAEALRRRSGGPARFVRINAVGSSGSDDDIAAVLQPGLAGICIAKVEAPADVKAVSEVLATFEQGIGLDTGRVLIVAGIESARGLLAAESIASSDPRATP